MKNFVISTQSSSREIPCNTFLQNMAEKPQISSQKHLTSKFERILRKKNDRLDLTCLKSPHPFWFHVFCDCVS